MDLPKYYHCGKCDKKYKHRQSLYNHIKRFHTHDTHISTPPSQNDTILPQNNTDKVTKKCSSEFMCPHCSKILSRKDSLARHIKTCKNKINIENENILLKKENEELKNQYKKYDEEIKELKDQLLDMMNKQCKMHHQTFNKIQNQLINNNQYNNCTFNIVQLGDENLINTLSEKEQLKVLNKKYNSLNYLVDYIHCNDKFPEFNNVIITNLQNNIAYMYNKDKKRFIAKKKDDLIDDIIYYRMGDLEEFYDIHLDTLDKKTREVISDVINKMDDDTKYISKKKEEVKLVLYNNKNDTIDGFNLIK